jgi:MFS family permease
MPAGQLRLLGGLAFAIYFENYDQALLTQAVKQIAETFRVAEEDLGNLLGWVRLGAVPAFVLIPLADYVGRRRLFLVSVLVMGVSSAAAGLAQSVEVFIGFQMVARTFMVTGSATAFVIVTEQVGAAYRGWGIGILGGLGAFGVGLSAMLFAVVDYLPFGWRAMYMLAIVPMMALPKLASAVSESQRFEDHVSGRDSAVGWLRGWGEPLVRLLRAYPARTLAIGFIGGMGAIGQGAAYGFSAWHVQTVHGWAPAQYSVMLLVAGTVGVVGYPMTGILADRFGRRRIGFLLFAGFPLLTLGFYSGPGWLLPVVWIPLIFALTGVNTIGRVLATEMFPTSYRGTSAGFYQLLDAIGGATGLFLVSLMTGPGESAAPAVIATSLGAWIAAIAVAFVPETSQRELEAISEDR